jgi:glycosyltransferase domain-containing protein
MSNLAPFTLLLLVKGRHEFTERWLKYMDSIKFEFPIIIADGENDGVTEDLIKKANTSKNLAIEFYQYNTHGGYNEYYSMKYEALNKVKTDYVMLCDNDDFILQYGLKKLIDFAVKNPEYISVSGKILNFEIDDFAYAPFGSKINFLKPCEYYRKEEPLDDWKNHIKSVFTEFQPNFYNIFQKKYLLIVANELTKLNFSDLVINEFYIQLRTATLGKSKVLDAEQHYLRQRGTSSISKNYVFSEDLIRCNMPLDVRKMADEISKLISLGDDKLKADIENCILDSFAKYLNHFLAHTTLRYRFKRLYEFKQKLLYIYKNYFFFFRFLNKKILENIFFKNLTKSIKIEDSGKLKNELFNIKSFLSSGK